MSHGGLAPQQQLLHHSLRSHHNGSGAGGRVCRRRRLAVPAAARPSRARGRRGGGGRRLCDIRNCRRQPLRQMGPCRDLFGELVVAGSQPSERTLELLQCGRASGPGQLIYIKHHELWSSHEPYVIETLVCGTTFSRSCGAARLTNGRTWAI